MDLPALTALIVPPAPVNAAAPSRLAVLRYSAWREAETKTVELGRRTRQAKVFVFPVWVGRATGWEAATVVAFDDGSHRLIPGATPGPVVVLAMVEDTRTAVIDDAERHPPEIALPLRNKYYAAVVVARIDRVLAIERVVDAPAVAAPRREVAVDAVDAELAVAPGDLDIAELLAKVVARLRVAPAN